MSIVSKPANENYRDNWDATFGKKALMPKLGDVVWVCLPEADATGRIIEIANGRMVVESGQRDVGGKLIVFRDIPVEPAGLAWAFVE
jgi:hypothetical protein